MGVSWSIHTESVAEMRALASEGAPEAHMSYTSAMQVMTLAGFDVTPDDIFFEVPADRCAEVAELLATSDFWQATDVAAVCAAAAQLGRAATAA